MRSLIIALLLAGAPVAAMAQSVPPAIEAALAGPDRPAADKERDATRKPGEIVAFAGIEAGDKVADFIMGGGYFTRILSNLVGETGHVYAYQPAEFIAFRADYAKEQDIAVAGRANVTPLRGKLGEIAFPEPLDAIVTVQNYHDLHLKQAPADFAGKVAARLLAALKPGGTLLVIDHVANTDPGFAAPDTLHRIDPAAARAEIEQAGFEFVDESALLRNAADPHTANVFDASIRGKTDQFIYKFRKPM